ncbi:SRPBCC family protein [Streptosporangium sp. NPDC020145]|uniref:aromatase/cyclase n=1 Tax=Streptosporangium sp. NPDC020145 TaxID=3154694 RepID=UPI0034329902
MSTHRTEHTLTVDAPARVLYDLVSNAGTWPAVFGPSVYVRHLERDANRERFRIWAVVNDEVRSWTSRRELDPQGLSVTFRQEHSRPPLSSMGGGWRFRELPGGRTEIVLEHVFETDGTPEALTWVTAALDRNSPEELAALARIATLAPRPQDVVVSFTDTVEVPGTAAEAYDFIHRADLWERRLPHVERVSLREDAQGAQVLEMSTRTADGAAHETRSIRICEPGAWIAYKQQLTPALLLGHSGLWTFTDGTGGTGGAVVTSRHTAVISPEAVPAVLGPGRTLADAREYVRTALSRNSLATLEAAAAQARAAR